MIIYYRIIFCFICLITGTSIIQSAETPCTCTPPQTSLDVAQNALHIFTGTVTRAQTQKITLNFDVVTQSFYETYVTFKVDKMYKGQFVDTIEVLLVDGVEPCDKGVPDFTFGDRYAISTLAKAKGKSAYTNNYCCLRKKLDKIAILDTLPPEPSAPVSKPVPIKKRTPAKKAR